MPTKTLKTTPTLDELAAMFSGSNAAHAYLANLRWGNDKPCCQQCRSSKNVDLPGVHAIDRRFHCRRCRYKFSAIVGTAMENSKIPLYKWLQAMYFLATEINGKSAGMLGKQIGVSGKSARRMMNRMRNNLGMQMLGLGGIIHDGNPLAREYGMDDVTALKPSEVRLPDAERRLIVETDDGYLKGTSKGMARYAFTPPRPHGRRYQDGLSRRHLASMIVFRERNGNVRFSFVKSLKRKHLDNLLNKALCKPATISTDGATWFDEKDGVRRLSTVHSAGEYVIGKASAIPLKHLSSALKSN